MKKEPPDVIVFDKDKLQHANMARARRRQLTLDDYLRIIDSKIESNPTNTEIRIEIHNYSIREQLIKELNRLDYAVSRNKHDISNTLIINW